MRSTLTTIDATMPRPLASSDTVENSLVEDLRILVYPICAIACVNAGAFSSATRPP